MDSILSLVVGEEGCTLNDVVEVFFNEVNSDTVFERWADFASELGSKSLQIKEWRQDKLMNKLTLKDVLREILESWKAEKGNDATLPNLIHHLENIKLKNVADDLKKLFSTKNKVPKVEQLFKPTLPDKSNYYISRTVVTRRVIDAKVFSSTHKDIFVVHEIGRHRLSQLAKRELTDTSASQVGKQKLSVRFILLQNFGDWAMLCGMTVDPMHLLKHHEGKFHWICTNGDISALQTASDEKKQDELSEEKFIEQVETEHQFQPNQPICISDSPGMGKSLLLASIGRQLQQRYPQRCIAFIAISEFVVKIRELLPKCNSTKNAVVEALLQMCENSAPLVQKMTTPTEDACTQIELMFDGFDEVSTKNVELALECLETLKTNFNSTTRVWVTTRPQHLHELEKRFSVLGYKIQAFQDKHQIEFLTLFWKSHGTKLDDGKLQSFSKTCLRTLKKKLNKKDEDIAGIPLQCMMIAEVYMQNAHRFCDSKNERFQNCPETDSVVINSIAGLYEKMIASKFEKFIETYPLNPEEIGNIWPLHTYLALELIFSSRAHEFKDTLQIESGLKPDYLVNIGILERSGSTTEDPPRFVHRTFAEFLAARYFVKYEMVKSTAGVKNSIRGLPDFLFVHVFKTFAQSWFSNDCSFEHSAVCYFVDTLLVSHTEISTENSINQSSTGCIKDVINACIHSDFGNIIKFLYNLKYPESFSIKKILYSDSKIVIDATRKTFLDLLKFLLNSFEHKPLTAIAHFKWLTALHASARRGSYTIFEYILKEHHFEDLVKEDTEFLNLVYEAVTYTLNCGLNEIEDRVEIVTTLCDLNEDMLNYCRYDNKTPLLADRVNIKLLKTLIDCGANLFQFDEYKNTILHKATLELSPTDYYDLLQYIPKTTLNSLLQMHGETTLHRIVKSGRATPDILQFILSNGVDINASDDRGITCVFYAVDMPNQGKTIPTVKMLLENGADHTRVDLRGNSILHYSALRGRIDCLQFFLEEKKMNVNQINEEGNTPIFDALRNGHAALETVDFLLQRHADYKILNTHRQNVLHYAAKLHRMECLQLFLTLGGLDINEVDGDGNTPLLCALLRYHENTVEMIRLLLGKCADHAISNKKGNNVLHLVAASANAECLSQFDRLPSLDVNARNCDSDTPLHLLIKNIKNYFHREDDLNSFLNTIEALVSLGADVNAKNHDGKTPLCTYQLEMIKWKYNEELLEKGLTIQRLLEGAGRENHLQ